jgi:Dolichyl-phosphate-mannose-protein mannosyltransferase
MGLRMKTVSLPKLRFIVIFALLLLLTVTLQWIGQSYSSEFGGADESAHFMTGLMIRDYIAAGFPGTPMKFAEDYYLHYPKVAFGMWGPLLQVTEAVWTLIFPPTHLTLILLMALITTVTAAALYWALADEFGMGLAFMGAVLFVALPTIQRYAGMIMADPMVGLLDFCAALYFGKYLNTRRTKHVLGFAAFTCLSILTKGNGVALAVVPAFAILFTRQFSILKERSLWVAAAIVIGVTGPWEYYSIHALTGIAQLRHGWQYIPGYTFTVLTLLGVCLTPVVAVGVYDRLIAPARRHSLDGKWAAAAALICAVWIFHCLSPLLGVDKRYLIPAMPPMLMFLVAGIETIGRRLPLARMSPHRRTWAIAALVLLVFMATEFSVHRKRYFGFSEAAERVEEPEYKGSVLLVASEGEGWDGEGMFISEIAMRDKRPSHIVLRATKMLSQSDWMGARYKLLYNTPEEVMNFLRSVPVEIVVIHSESGEVESPDHKLLRQAIAEFPTEWQHLGTYPKLQGTKGGSTIDVYRLKSAAGRHVGTIRIDLPFTLRRPIEHYGN